MPSPNNRFVAIDIQLEVESLQSCQGDSERCEIAQKIRSLDAIQTDLLPVYQSQIGPIACKRCIEQSSDLETLVS